MVVVNALSDELGAVFIEKIKGRQFEADGVTARGHIEIRTEMRPADRSFADRATRRVIAP